MLMKNMISFFSFGIEHNDGTLPSMGNRVRENIDDDHSGNNQGQPDNGSHVKVLFENEKADKRNKNDTHSRPNGVSYAYRDCSSVRHSGNRKPPRTPKWSIRMERVW